MDLRQRLFKVRSYTPIPFLCMMIVFASPTVASLATGLAVVIAGESVRFWGVAIAGSETRTTGTVGGTFLITTGPFAYIRNPLYVGNIAMYLGFGIMSHALFPWLPIIALGYFVAQYSLIVSLEEDHLRGKFGEAYERYCAAVPRFLPAMHPYREDPGEQPDLDWKRGARSEKRTLQAIVLLTALMLTLWLWKHAVT